MYLSLTIFFISLAGIIIMIGRKIIIPPEGQRIVERYTHPFMPDSEKVRAFFTDSLKRYGHGALVMILRFYVKISNFFKYHYGWLKTKINDTYLKRNGNGNGNGEGKVESSKFLKMVSEYKRKLREIRHKIHEEENSS